MRMLVFVLVSLLLVGGCAAEKPIVRTQASPNPFVNQHAFGVVPVEFTGLRIGDIAEADYLASKSVGQRADFAGDKAVFNEEFSKAMTAKLGQEGVQVLPAEAPFIVHPVIFWIEPGYYVGISAGNGEAKMALQITAPDGKVLDEVVLHSAISGFTTRQRMARNGELLGKAAADYLASRIEHRP